MNAELLRRAADVVERMADEAPPGPWRDVQSGWCLRSEPSSDEGTWRTVAESVNPFARPWLETFTPAIAGPLGAWLRAASDAAVSYPNVDGVHGRIMSSDEQPPAYRHTVEFIKQAEALARVILGEEAS